MRHLPQTQICVGSGDWPGSEDAESSGAGSAGMCMPPPTGLSDFSDLVTALEKDKGARDSLFSIPPCYFLSASNAFRSHGRLEIRK